jgi:hypothetical protein
MLSTQATNTNQICKLKKHLVSITTKLQKVCQQLTNVLHNKLHGKSANKATPTAPPTTPHIITPAAPHLQKHLNIWGNLTKNLTWAECLNATVNQQDKPFTTVMCKNKKPTPITIMPKALPRIEREVIITCETHVTKINRVNFANYTLNRVNHIINQSANITLLPFILAQINSNSKLVLMTNPTTPVTAYVSYLQMLTTNIKALQLMDPHINGYWSKFLVYDIPTKANLRVIKTTIKLRYPSLHLTQDPCWLVPKECHLNKTSSTIIISLISIIDMKHLGITSLTICNHMCYINTYFSWTPTLHCNHYQGYGHHMKLCKANKPTCAMCTQQHTTQDYSCPIPTYHTGGTCIYPPFKYASCGTAHKANNPLYLVRVKHLTDLRNTTELTPQDETMEPQV